MKKGCMYLSLLALLMIFTVPAAAQEQENTSPFQDRLTYIRYRLNHDALPVWNIESLEEFIEETPDTTTITFKNGEIDEIDAYFEFVVPDTTLDNRYNLLCNSWNIGDIAVALGYDRIYEGTANDPLLGDEHLIRGKLNMPLGGSSFSVGAYLAMYAVNYDSVQEALAENLEPQTIVQADDVVEIPEGASRIAQTTSVRGPMAQEETGTVHVPVSKALGSNNAVLGAVNFSGAVKGVDVFTEVGFASSPGAYTVNRIGDEIDVENFYALGGAKYTLGQVTLGIEAGFENGDEPIDDLSDNYLGFENDFWSDSIIEDNIPGDELHDKLYAKVSASMNPTEKMSVEGAFSCVKPVEMADGADAYGFEVNGTFYYSLTDYIQYLIKAGAVSLEHDSIGDSQYKVLNKVEFRF